jgi:signal peptidase II
MKKKIFPLDRKRTVPLILAVIIILADQLTKFFIVKNWPLPEGEKFRFIKDIFNNDILWIIHVRNKDIAFSLGAGFPEFIKPALFIVLPLLVLGFLLWYYLGSDEFSPIQRWAAAGIIGGGIGNIVDRIFRPDGVVDFISVKFYGLFGFERWPTFNIADSSVVVCCIILFLTVFIGSPKTEKKPRHEQKI